MMKEVIQDETRSKTKVSLLRQKSHHQQGPSRDSHHGQTAAANLQGLRAKIHGKWIVKARRKDQEIPTSSYQAEKAIAADRKPNWYNSIVGARSFHFQNLRL